MLFKDVKAGQLFRQDGTVWLKNRMSKKHGSHILTQITLHIII